MSAPFSEVPTPDDSKPRWPPRLKAQVLVDFEYREQMPIYSWSRTSLWAAGAGDIYKAGTVLELEILIADLGIYRDSKNNRFIHHQLDELQKEGYLSPREPA